MTTSSQPAAARVRARVERFHEVRVAGEWDGRELLFGRAPEADDVLVNSNDYLALAGDDRVVKRIAESLADGYVHGGHAQLVLERDLAAHMHAPAGVLCQSGWDANLGLLQAIADAHTPVYVDQIAHMSLAAGARLAGAPLRVFRHNDLDHLRSRIDRHGPGVVAVEALYSTNGSHCPLPELCDLAEETGCVLVVDESHSLGTTGPLGAGMVVELGLAGRVHFRIASLSKAFAGRAGFVTTTDPAFVPYFRLESFPAVFSSALLSHDLAGLAATLEAVRTDEWRRDRLHQVSEWVRDEVAALGFDLEGSASHIVALQTGTERATIEVRELLEEHGVFGSVFAPPATPQDRALVRLSLHAGLGDDDVDRIIAACEVVRDRWS
ncbi:alpha-hydroxyketone-type quorum-sensing autoinducer synthase [Herbidospora sp. NBRC 101105]|uniref:alpha-hydroxyketone-type quorum-sensing autoinducer synthase n=1 Tax=Herbidospora sp. NBRC 101105 TaxID=3032195 RepID=UPI0024A56DE6|nr:alpha-hydroxyketone-type quorum-sensing autoinducer synthase [Herbidospora sp. NBRC 101105]GLX92240.1 CAI-1 autoinducer synthase [Herbidospora sp. NBRC 101105]